MSDLITEKDNLNLDDEKSTNDANDIGAKKDYLLV